ncbi:MAG: uroporphyrinogen decarboxylase [Elusimicrobia bacterium]|nr:uroporphyrinogen decarboxylase [Elusimicrobiota bacterium]
MIRENLRFLRACRSQPVDATPVWFMRQAGRYMGEYRELRKTHSILALAKTPELACEVTLQPLRALPVDAAILFADILLVLEPMGLKLKFAPGPSISNPVRSAADVKRLRAAGAAAELDCVFRAVRLIRREIEGERALIGFAGAPFTVASYMIEGGPSDHYKITKAMMTDRPDLWDALMRKVRTVTAEYLEAQVAAGAQAVQLFDSWIGALSPDQYRRFVRPHSKWVLDRLEKTGVPVISFGTGTNGFLEDFAGAGGSVIGVDWRIDLDAARRRIGKKAVQGNLDPLLLFSGERALKAAVKDIIDRNGGRKGHIFNLGHGILPTTPVDSVRRVAQWVHEMTAA